WRDNSNNIVSTNSRFSFTVPNADVAYKAIFKNANYLITAKASDILMGNVSGARSYLDGTLVSLTAIPKTGFRFVNWTRDIDSEVVSANLTYNFTATQPAAFTANFVSEGTYQIYAASEPGGSIVDGNGAAFSTGTFSKGDTVTLKVIPVIGYEFLGWAVGSNIVSNTEIYMFNASADRTVTAKFKKILVVDAPKVRTDGVDGNAPGGSVNVKMKGTGLPANLPYNGGDAIELTATASDSNFRFVGWKYKDGSLDKLSNPLTVIVGVNEIPVAEFVTASSGGNTQYLATAVSTKGGAVNPSATLYKLGDTKSFTATPDSGYQFLKWTNGAGIDLNGNAEYTITPNGDGTSTIAIKPTTTGDKDLVANFKAKSFTPLDFTNPGGHSDLNGTATLKDENGKSFTPTDEIPVGSQIFMFANPKSGYEFEGWMVNSTKISTFNPFLYTVTAATQISNIPIPSFKQRVLLIDDVSVPIGTDGKANNSGGVVTITDDLDLPISSGTSVSGKKIKLSATANADFAFTGWRYKDGTLMDSSNFVTLKGVYSPDATGFNPLLIVGARDEVPKAEFVSNGKSLIILTKDPALGGYVKTPDGKEFMGGSYSDNDNLTLSATASGKYKFVSWLDSNSNEIGTSPTLNYTVNGNQGITAHFAKITYKVDATASFGGAVKTSGISVKEGEFQDGEAAYVTATPNHLNTLVNFTINGSSIVSLTDANVTNNNDGSYTYKFTVSEDTTVQANFKGNDKYAVTAVAGEVEGKEAGYISQSGTGAYSTGDSVQLLALVNTGYQFVKWTDFAGETVSTSPSYNYTVGGADVSFVAVYKAGEATGGGGADLKTVNVSNEAYRVDSGNVTTKLTAVGDSYMTLDDNGAPVSMGKVSGEGTWLVGVNMVVAAEPSSGYKFVGWSITDPINQAGDNIVSTKLTYVLKAPDTDKTYVANFSLMDKVTVNGYTAEAAQGKVKGSGVFTKGNAVALNAVANTDAGFKFSYWLDITDDTPRVVSDNPTYVFEAKKDVNIMAYFAPSENVTIVIYKFGKGEITYEAFNEDMSVQYAPTVAVYGPKGSHNVISIPKGYWTFFTATAEDGYFESGWYDNDDNLQVAFDGVLFSEIKTQQTFQVRFEPNPGRMARAYTNGFPSNLGGTTKIVRNETSDKYIFSATPNQGYEFEGWVEGKSTEQAEKGALNFYSVEKQVEFNAGEEKQLVANFKSEKEEKVKRTLGKAKIVLSPQKKKKGSKYRSVKISLYKIEGAEKYTLYVKTSTGKWKKIKTLQQGKSLKFTHNKLEKKKTYTYKLVVSATGKNSSTIIAKVKTIK
ncbi:MAG: InlB B-repeat-containing protein, partial [Anaerovoracaceae bacterium]